MKFRYAEYLRVHLKRVGVLSEITGQGRQVVRWVNFCLNKKNSRDSGIFRGDTKKKVLTIINLKIEILQIKILNKS